MFKYKEGGWKTSPKRTKVDFEDGHYKVYEGEKNLFMHGYLSSNLYINFYCGKCKFKNVPHPGNVMLADFWGIDKKLDDDKETSLLLINTEKRKKFFEKVRDNMVCYLRNFDEVLAGNPMLVSSVVIPKETEKFLEDLDKMKFSEAIKKYTNIPIMKKIINKVNKIYKIK